MTTISFSGKQPPSFPPAGLPGTNQPSVRFKGGSPEDKDTFESKATKTDSLASFNAKSATASVLRNLNKMLPYSGLTALPSSLVVFRTKAGGLIGINEENGVALEVNESGKILKTQRYRKEEIPYQPKYSWPWKLVESGLKLTKDEENKFLSEIFTTFGTSNGAIDNGSGHLISITGKIFENLENL